VRACLEWWNDAGVLVDADQVEEGVRCGVCQKRESSMRGSRDDNGCRDVACWVGPKR